MELHAFWGTSLEDSEWSLSFSQISVVWPLNHTRLAAVDKSSSGQGIDRAAESEFRIRWKTIFSGPPARADRLKICTLNRIDWLCFRVTWAWSERFDLCKRLMMVLSRKTKTYTTFSDPVPPSRPTGLGNSHRLPAGLVSTGNLTPVFQPLVSYPLYSLWLLLIYCIKY
jgi:hypothetical protein